ncbi:DNA/RNA non-specific endonuclease [Poritiphilus flavus]|uniref:Endonuclease n=1 Tax=Poritiphilus flavus TaxID=2697053 RepID=A0A6L9EDH0_9FLAO|nr:DNA/RNA non-specific endonuclease [Poritiphilus flavus]NAS12824.1 DNA/RNA non-specific endonuclease [Poritiphilus flavus]
MRKSRRNQLIYTLLLVLCIVGFWIFENFYTPATYSKPEDISGNTVVPEFFRPATTTGVLVRHQHYALSYREADEQSEWVAYTLKRSHLTQDDRERPYFIEDPKIASHSADWRNYRGSGYDRGHLCPAGDRRFSEQAYNETFYTSNISPQDRDFNAGIWNRLEMQVRNWCRRYGELYVVTGGVLSRPMDAIGEEEVTVPGSYYKIIARGNPGNLKVIAFVIPNKETSAPLKSFCVAVDRIEELTGIDFFENLPEAEEKTLEGSLMSEDWEI